MRKAVVIIGSSYGDEGKGLAAACAARDLARPCLNVLINGGAQRGHTVDLPDGRRHVFHHFGSGAVHGAVSYADEDFIVNPLLYMDERIDLADSLGLAPELRASSRCRVTLPWDMMLGQIIEENRGEGRHGSCGCGIFETRLRYEQTDWALSLGQMAALTKDEFIAHARRIIDEYIPARLSRLGMTAGAAWADILPAQQIAENTWADLTEMLAAVRLFGTWQEAAEGFPSLVFECGQGLALDEDNQADFPYLTPSKTTSAASVRRIAALPGLTDVELRYITRSYLTRHGAGPFPTECDDNAIGTGIHDRTNVPNPHQQTLRYGLFDGEAVLRRTMADATEARGILPHARTAAVVTHLNETGGELRGNITLADFTAHFDRAYLSDTPCDIPHA